VVVVNSQYSFLKCQFSSDDHCKGTLQQCSKRFEEDQQTKPQTEREEASIGPSDVTNVQQQISSR